MFIRDSCTNRYGRHTLQSNRHLDAEAARAAQELATYALVLLTAGILLVGLAVAAILAAVRLARRYRKPMTHHAGRLFVQVNRIPVLGPVLAGARVVLPTRYVALHLMLGLVATAAIVGFIVIAEEVVAGRTIAAFDVAFADALWSNTSARWQKVFRVITALGSTPLLLAASTVIAAGLLRGRYYVLAVGWIIGQAGGPILN